MKTNRECGLVLCISALVGLLGPRAATAQDAAINGPRIIPSERINLRGTPDEARAAVRAMAAKGIKHTGEIGLTPEPGPTPQEIDVLKAPLTKPRRPASRSTFMR
jgi:hypothetical protein